MSEPRKFRKKPVVIEAMEHTAMPEQCQAIVEWSGARFDVMESAFYITTLEGEMRADPGDWIIRGVQGEFYPCKPDIFEATYENAEGATDAAE
jgi:hypothetical protein